MSITSTPAAWTPGPPPAGLRVALVTGSFDPERCGVSHYTLNLAGALRRIGVDPVVLADRLPGRRRELPADAPRHVEAVDGWSLGQLDRLARSLVRLRADVLHVQFAPLSYRGGARALRLLPAVLRARGWHGPLVVTLHEYTFEPAAERGVRGRVGRAARWAGAWDQDTGLLVPFASAIVTTNPSHRDRLLEAQPRARGRLLVVPIASNLPVVPAPDAEHAAAIRRDLGLPPSGPLVVFFGFVHPVKGLEHLIAAMRVVRERHPTATLVIAGAANGRPARRRAAGNP